MDGNYSSWSSYSFCWGPRSQRVHKGGPWYSLVPSSPNKDHLVHLLMTAYLTQVFLLLESPGTLFKGEACNEYVDGVLNDMKEDKEIFQDPYQIPEKSVEVSKKVIFVNYTGEARLYDGHIFGMSSLHRENDVVVDKSKTTHLKIWLAGGEFKLQCRGKVKLMGHGPQVRIDAKVAYVGMKLDVVPSKKGSNPKINNFSLESVKGLDVQVSEMGPLKFFFNPFVKIAGTVFKNLIKNAIESKLKAFMDKKIKNYEIPDACLNEASRRSLSFS